MTKGEAKKQAINVVWFKPELSDSCWRNRTICWAATSRKNARRTCQYACAFSNTFRTNILGDFIHPNRSVQVKRDPRLSDHAPPAAAIAAGKPTLLLFFFEPSLWQHPTTDARHWRFQLQSLEDMAARLEPLEIALHIVHGEVLPFFEALRTRFHIDSLFSYQETGVRLTYDRDLAMLDFCAAHGIQWTEAATMGIHTIRINNPVKQLKEHHPDGDFTRQWVPEPAEVRSPLIHEPRQMTDMEQQFADCETGLDYPFPIVDLVESGRSARSPLVRFKAS